MKVKQVKKIAKNHALGGSSLGLSAAAVIWMYHAFVPRTEYDKEYRVQQDQNNKLWHSVHEQGIAITNDITP